MRSYQIRFPEANRAEVVETDILPDELQSGEALVRGIYSVISAGTELANYTHLAEEAPGYTPSRWPGPFPRYPGYGHLGEVVAVGPDTPEVKVGDRILTFSQHGSLVKANVRRFALPVPKDVDPRKAVLTRMASVSITAVRASSVAAGDRVVVIGLGLVGNFAAQIMQIAGADVLGVDLSQDRLELAGRCGVRRTVNPRQADLEREVLDWTDGQGARIVVEAIGRSELVAQAVELAGKHGEVILLGSPRARVTMEVTPMLSRIHLLAIKMIGALEWTFPIPETEGNHFTILENNRQILGWIASGRLIVDPLISHVLQPEEAQSAYDGLLNRKDEYLGVLFDWRRLAE